MLYVHNRPLRKVWTLVRAEGCFSPDLCRTKSHLLGKCVNSHNGATVSMISIVYYGSTIIYDGIYVCMYVMHAGIRTFFFNFGFYSPPWTTHRKQWTLSFTRPEQNEESPHATHHSLYICCMSVWRGGFSASDWKTVRTVLRTMGEITGTSLPFIQNIVLSQHQHQ